MKLGAILQACRERAGFSQEHLAEVLNKSRVSISKIENNRKTLDVQTLFQWAEATGSREVVVSFLYGMDGLSMIQHLMSVGGIS